MRRLSLFVKNKTELIGNAAQLGVGVLHPDNLEKSGLSSVEIFHLEQWVSGKFLFFFILCCSCRLTFSFNENMTNTQVSRPGGSAC
jgi:hypothetical protein